MKNLRKIITTGIIAIAMLANTSCVFADNKTDNKFEQWFVSASKLNCRKTPDYTRTDNIITTFDKGTELSIIGIDDTGKWWEVWDGKTQGWCYSTYFVKNKDDLDKQTANNTVGTCLGSFYITGYTPSPSENGGYSVTAMGDNLWNSVGWAIAADPRVLPMNTKVYIEGIGVRVVRDTGGAIKGNKIDVLCSSNSESYAITGYRNVYLVQ